MNISTCHFLKMNRNFARCQIRRSYRTINFVTGDYPGTFVISREKHFMFSRKFVMAVDVDLEDLPFQFYCCENHSKKFTIELNLKECKKKTAT